MKYANLAIKDSGGEIKETLKVSALCFGSLCMGPLQSRLSVKEGAQVMRHAFGLGVNFVDTAQIYLTYPYIKAALDSFAGKNKIVISTKSYAYTKKLAAEALDEALRELGKTHIDIFMLHEQESVHTIYGHIEALEYLFEQKKAGRIKAVGISTHHVAGVLGAVEFNRTYKKDRLEVIHPMYNMAGLGIVAENNEKSEAAAEQMGTALAEAKKCGFFVFAMKALGGGNLFSQSKEALGFVLGKPFVDSVAVGMKSIFETEANAYFFENGDFPESYDNHAQKNKTKRLHIDSWCEGCGKCVLACPANALSANQENKAVCNAGKCVLCGYCSAACDVFAIKII